jgi:hypothetical protein
MVYCDNAVRRIEKIDDESVREAVLLAAEAEPRRFKGTGAGYVLVYQHGGAALRSVVSKAEALATSASLRDYPKSKGRIEATGVFDMFANKIRVQGDRDKAILTTPGRNGRFGDDDDIERYINLNGGYFYDKTVSRLMDYDQLVDSIRRTYPTVPPLRMIPESRY